MYKEQMSQALHHQYRCIIFPEFHAIQLDSMDKHKSGLNTAFDESSKGMGIMLGYATFQNPTVHIIANGLYSYRWLGWA